MERNEIKGIEQCIIPEKALKKLRYAEKFSRPVYMYGCTGMGKTCIIEKYVRKRHIVLDGKALTEEKLCEAEKSQCGIVVIDQLFLIADESVQIHICRMLLKKAKWFILISRSRVPAWLMDTYLKKLEFVLVDESDMQMQEVEIRKLMEYFKIKLSDSEVAKIGQLSRGNGLVVGMVLEAVQTKGFCNEAFSAVESMLMDYLELSIVNKWDMDFLEFLLKISVVEKFDVSMANMVTGCSNSMIYINKAEAAGNFISYDGKEYWINDVLLRCLRRLLDRTYTIEQINSLYCNAGIEYEHRNSSLEALKMYEKCGQTDRIINTLVENAKKNPGASNLYYLRNYYERLSQDIIEQHIELAVGMSMLKSLLLETEESEKWYQYLKKKKESAQGIERRTLKGWIAYLDIALPHHGTAHMIDTMKNVGILFMNNEASFPEFGVTANLASMMNGGLDFCEWSKKDKELAKSIGTIVSMILGKYGKGLVELALAESFFEKGMDNYEVLVKASSGGIKAANGGKLQQVFVSVGIQAKVHAINGHLQEARDLIVDFRNQAVTMKEDNLVDNAETFLCRLAQYDNNFDVISEWMETAPKENVEFYTLDRYRYLTKVRIYIQSGQYELAMVLLAKLSDYALVMKRIYIQIEVLLLKSIVEYRLGKEKWKNDFQEVLTRAEEYHFIRIISKEGAAVAKMFEEAKWEFKDSSFATQLHKEIKQMQRQYPSYLKENQTGEIVLSENARTILILQSEGYSHADIARELSVTISNVKYHCNETYKKLGVKGKTGAVAEAKKRHII